MKPKFVYFDLGGVVILDFSGTNKWNELQEELGIPPEKKKEFEIFWEQYEPQLCIGKDTDSLLPIIKEKFKVKTPENYSLLLDGFVLRFEINASIWPIINEVRSTSRIGLLTNMYPKMLKEIKSRGLLPEINWDILIDSSVEKIQKPDSEIFTLAEEKARVTGSEILFVENSMGHIGAAKKFKWQTFFYDSTNSKNSSEKLIAFFRKL